MVLKFFIVFAIVLSFCTVCFVFSSNRLASLLCSFVLMLATSLMFGSDCISRLRPLDSYPGESDWITERSSEDKKGALVLKAALIVPQLAVESTKLHEDEFSGFQEVATPSSLRRSASYTQPRTNYWELDVLLHDDGDQAFWAAETSMVDCLSELGIAKDSDNTENLEKAPSLSAEQVSELADSFIARFHERMRLERQESEERAWETLTRKQVYEAMLDRSGP